LAKYNSSAGVGGGGPRQTSSIVAVGATHATSSKTAFVAVMGTPATAAHAARTRTKDGHAIAHWFRDRFNMDAMLADEPSFAVCTIEQRGS
jgi:hypothetical protein